MGTKRYALVPFPGSKFYQNIDGYIYLEWGDTPEEMAKVVKWAEDQLMVLGNMARMLGVVDEGLLIAERQAGIKRPPALPAAQPMTVPVPRTGIIKKAVPTVPQAAVPTTPAEVKTALASPTIQTMLNADGQPVDEGMRIALEQHARLFPPKPIEPEETATEGVVETTGEETSDDAPYAPHVG